MTAATPQGWYDDPEDLNGQRYWDGQAWTPHRQQKLASQPSSAPNVPPPPPQQAAWQPPGQQQAGPPPQQSSTRRWVTSAIGGIPVLLVVIFARHLPSFFTNKTSSPEDQIRAVMQSEVDYANKSDFSWRPELECKAIAAAQQAHADDLRALRAQSGTWSVSVANIHVTGDSATADVTFTFEKLPDKPQSNTDQFVKEDSKWKECTPYSSNGNSQDNGGQDNGGQGG
jgi:hypothetical protein